MGEVLHEVDFNQLKIENQQYLEKIDDRNKDLLRLKLMTGNVLQVLNTYKVCLSNNFLNLAIYVYMYVYKLYIVKNKVNSYRKSCTLSLLNQHN